MASIGSGPRLVVSPENHEALIVLTAVICLSWTLLTIIVRLYLRLRLNGPFGPDDWLAVVATVLAVGQTSVTLVAVHYGIGEREKLLSPSQVDKSLKFIYAASILYIASICAAKCSMWQLTARLTRTELHMWASHSLTAFTVLWGITALFVIAMQCGLSAPWTMTTQQQCPNLFLGWAAIEAFSLFIEVLVCAVVGWLVYSLQMQRRVKVIVVGVFLMRLLIIIPTVFRLILLRLTLPLSDTTFTATDVVIATQVTMHYTVMAATLPCMRAFLQVFNSGLGATTGMTTNDGRYDNGSNSTAPSYTKGTTGNAGSGFGRSKSSKSDKSTTVIALHSIPDPRDSNDAVENTTTSKKSISRKTSTTATTTVTTLPLFRPDEGHTTTTTITSPAGDNHTNEKEQRSFHDRLLNRSASRASLAASDESKAPIIKKTLEWEVRHEAREIDVEAMFASLG